MEDKIRRIVRRKRSELVNVRTMKTWTAVALLVTSASLTSCKSRLSGSRVANLPLTEENVRTRIKDALHYLYTTQVKADRFDGELRLKGEWASYVRGSILPDDHLSALYDSNAFVPMFVVYPLFFIDDKQLPAAAQKVREMKAQTIGLLDRWYVDQRGETNFWPIYEGFHGPQQIFQSAAYFRLLGPVFDIANDADDTAVYYMTALKFKREFPDANVRMAQNYPRIFTPWLDKGRAREDERELAWKYRDTGGYLTWLTDELKPQNKQPISFMLANNVDCIVAGNVMYALGLTQQTSVEGYADTCTLAKYVMIHKHYPKCGFYYPPQWLYPYIITRAYRDGNAKCVAEPYHGSARVTEKPLDLLLETILAAQAGDGSWNDQGEYANLDADLRARQREFHGDARAYSTALNVVTLLNISATHHPDERLKTAAKAAVEKGVAFLLNSAVVEEGLTFWQGGVFFSSSYQQVARWKSRPYTTAVVLEALVKYVIGYDDPQKTNATLRLTEADIPQQWLR